MNIVDREITVNLQHIRTKRGEQDHLIVTISDGEETSRVGDFPTSRRGWEAACTLRRQLQAAFDVTKSIYTRMRPCGRSAA